MKTLDEVIFNFEYTTANGTLMMVDRDDFADALEYLKVYRAEKEHFENFVESYTEARDKHQKAIVELKRKEAEMNDIMTDYVALKQYWAEQQENPALSWEELREMKGREVWMKAGIDKNGTWNFILKGGDIVLFLVNPYGSKWMISENSYGKGMWQAYRKERE